MSNILVTGANGQLGSELQSLAETYKNYNFYFCDSKILDITNHEYVDTFVEKNKITVIINCAAYTAVDMAESEPEKAEEINHTAVKNLAKISKQRKCKLIHISTDYVFNGEGFFPYTEEELTNPIGVYGKTKELGEKAILKINPDNSLIIRTAWVYSEFKHNFVKIMLKLGVERDDLNVVVDQIGSPTNAGYLAKTILNVLPKVNHKGVDVFHYSNEGVCSWYDFTKAIFEIKGIKCKLNPIPSSAYPTKAKRPHYSVLSKEKIKTIYGIEIPYWRDALKECLEKL